jgi:hypothetical protein
MAEKIQDLEKAVMGEKPWQLTGDVSAQTRPENSLLEVDVAFDSASRMGTYHMLVSLFSLSCQSHWRRFSILLTASLCVGEGACSVR